MGVTETLLSVVEDGGGASDEEELAGASVDVVAPSPASVELGGGGESDELVAGTGSSLLNGCTEPATARLKHRKRHNNALA